MSYKGVKAKPPELHTQLKRHHHQRQQLQSSVNLTDKHNFFLHVYKSTHTKSYAYLKIHMYKSLQLQGTYIDVQAEGGDGRSLREGQKHEQHSCQQLHQVEQMIMSEQVGAESVGTPRMSEKLIIILSLLKTHKDTWARDNVYVIVWLPRNWVVFKVYNVKSVS